MSMGNHPDNLKPGPDPEDLVPDPLEAGPWQRLMHDMQAQGIDPTKLDPIIPPLEILSTQEAIPEDLRIIRPIRDYYPSRKQIENHIITQELNNSEYKFDEISDYGTSAVDPSTLDLQPLVRPLDTSYKPFGHQTLPDTFPTNPASGDEPREMLSRLPGESLSWRDFPENPVHIHPLFNYDQATWPGFELQERGVPEDAPRNFFADDWEWQQAIDARRRLEETLDPVMSPYHDRTEVFQWSLTNPQPGERLGETVYPQIAVTEQDLWNLYAITDDPITQRRIIDEISRLSAARDQANVALAGESEDTTGLLPYELDSIRGDDPKSRIRRLDQITNLYKDNIKDGTPDEGEE